MKSSTVTNSVFGFRRLFTNCRPTRICVFILTLCVASIAAGAASKPGTLDFIESLPSPPLMEGVGNSHLKISTQVEAAQQYFDQGVSQLHDFWWFEAFRSFRHAAQLDPESPMPHWGMYMAADDFVNFSSKERKRVQQQAIKAMQKRRGNASAREKLYLDAAEELQEKDEEKAAAGYKLALETLLNEYPDAIQARLFLWQQLNLGFDSKGRPHSEQHYGQLLLESQLAKHSENHALLHYWIHSQESGKHPESALGAAQKLASLAPNAGHIVHMPGHIHYLMGNYTSAHKQFVKAEETDLRYMKKYKIAPVYPTLRTNEIGQLSILAAASG